jgi:hydrogenase/urease accessory protein HupE
VLLPVCVLSAHSSFAHDPGLSSATVRFDSDRVQAVLTFALKDAEQMLDSVHGGSNVLGAALPGRGKEALQSLLTEEFRLTVDGRKASVNSLSWQTDPQGNISISINWHSIRAGRIDLHSEFLHRMPIGHRQYLIFQSAENKILGEWMLSADRDSATLQMTVQPAHPDFGVRRSVARFLEMGIKHILNGYDHILFLLALLVVTRRFAPAVKIITSFTVAHSLSLGLATMNVLPLPGRIVEPLIAASIVYVGIENLIRGEQLKGRWLLAFAFGLIHGCGFASALRDLGVGMDGRGIALPLLSFNLGVELGQMGLAAVALPLFWQLRNRPILISNCVPAASIVVVLLGAYWFVERVWF